jgi:hypothetical protein
MLRFCKKNFLIGPLLGEIGLFRVYSVYAKRRFFCELGKKKFFFFNSQVSSLYLLVIDFPKFNPLAATEIVFYRKISQNGKIYLAYAEYKRNRL